MEIGENIFRTNAWFQDMKSNLFALFRLSLQSHRQVKNDFMSSLPDDGSVKKVEILQAKLDFISWNHAFVRNTFSRIHDEDFSPQRNEVNIIPINLYRL